MLEEVRNNSFNNNIKYFLKMIDKYKADSISPIEFNIFSCEQLLEEIILECQSNNLSNKMNNDFFSKKIDFLTSKKYLVNNKQKKDLNFLCEQIYSRNTKLVYALALEIQKQFCNKNYFNKLIDELKEMLDNENIDNSIDIKILLENILIELVNKGYSIKYISEKIKNLFAYSSYDKDSKVNYPNTRFPCELVKNIPNPNELSDYINNLSIKERINYIKEFYITKKNTYYLIIPINGITISNKIIKCNKEIELYNPNFLDPYSLKIGTIREDKFNNVDYKSCANACIKTSAFNFEEAYKNGIKKINDYINILKLLSLNNNLKVIENHKVLLNNKKQLIAFASESYINDYTKREFERNIRPLDDEELFSEKDSFKISNQVVDLICNDKDITNTKTILQNSIKKYSDGIDNINKEEAVLKFWSSIESLFDESLVLNGKTNKFEIIREVLSAYMTYALRYISLHNIYHELASITHLHCSNQNYRKKINKTNIPTTLLKKLNLYKISNKEFSLLPFVTYNKELQKYFSDYYYLPKLIYIDKYFNDVSFAKKNIKEIKREYEISLIIIYRLRNQIIHNAMSNSTTLNYYFPLLKRITSYFLNAILDEYINNNQASINELILSIYSKSILFIKDSETCPLLSLLF